MAKGTTKQTTKQTKKKAKAKNRKPTVVGVRVLGQGRKEEYLVGTKVWLNFSNVEKDFKLTDIEVNDDTVRLRCGKVLYEELPRSAVSVLYKDGDE